MALEITIADSIDEFGCTAYTLSIKSGGKEWTVKRRYREFEDLDSKLKALPGFKNLFGSASTGKKRIELPSKGMLGIRHKLNLGSFNAERQDGLNAYLATICSQVRSLDDVPCLLEFLSLSDGEAATGKGTYEVVYKPKVNVREGRDANAKVLGTKALGTSVVGVPEGDWLCLEGEPGYISIKNSAQGLLLQRTTLSDPAPGDAPPAAPGIPGGYAEPIIPGGYAAPGYAQPAAPGAYAEPGIPGGYTSPERAAPVGYAAPASVGYAAPASVGYAAPASGAAPGGYQVPS